MFRFVMTHSLQVRISALILGLVIAVGGVIGWLSSTHMNAIIDDATDQLFSRIGFESRQAIEQIYLPAEVTVEMLALQRVAAAQTMEERVLETRYLQGVLDQSPNVTAVFVGYDDGDFVLFRRARGENEIDLFDPPTGTRYIVQHIDRNRDTDDEAHFLYFDQDLTLLRMDEQPDYLSYDPRIRPWFEAAVIPGRQVKAGPYVFFSSGELGSTVAMRSMDHRATVAVDITLETLAQTLSTLKITPGSDIALTDADGLLVGHPDPNQVLRFVEVEDTGQGDLVQQSLDDLSNSALANSFHDASQQGLLGDEGGSISQSAMIDGESWRTYISPLHIEGTDTLFLVTAVPESELLADARQMMRSSLVAFVGILMVAGLVSLLAAGQISKPVEKLAREADEIRRFQFSGTVSVTSHITEIANLVSAMDGMKSTIRRFLEINQTVSGEVDFDHVLSSFLREVATLAHASHGIVYLVDEAQNRLDPAAHWGEDNVETPPLDLTNLPSLLQPALTQKTAFSADITGEDYVLCGAVSDLDDPGTSGTAIIVPLYNRSGTLNGIMALARRRKAGEALISFVDALSSSAAISLETRQLIKAQKELFDSFIMMLARAIDAKSPYTGGHCARIPLLTEMLAEAANDTTVGPFAGYNLDDQEREALRLAAWLHDCGKITTPDFVVDKATKLETVYDRIHEVRTRFEILKQETETRYWRQQASGTPEATARAERDAELAALNDDFAFVAECNIGGEFMSEDKVQRLEEIARRTWPKTLSSRLGISHIEDLRFQASGAVENLPERVPVLMDAPEHIHERDETEIVTPDNRWGFKMEQPKYLYNRGELYNLQVARGTLTAEERYKINEHIIQTIMMLEMLPFPNHLRHVPDLAAGHHEKMNGTGYPRQLKGNEMLPAARMMAIADIFEALTASDRPYKKGKTLSEALKIMVFMTKDGHLDPELYDLFLTSGIWKTYAADHLKEEQIDRVDIDALRASLPAAA